MALPGKIDVLTLIDWGPKLVIFVLFIALAINGFVNRHKPRVGGKLGRRSKAAPAIAVPDGFSRVECRAIVNYAPPPKTEGFANLKAYVRNAVQQPGLVHIYHVAAWETQIEFAVEPPRYERITPAEALALLRELPDPRFVLRLHLADAPSFLDPWTLHATGNPDSFHLGHATNFRLIVLYMPDRRLGHELGLTLIHEWLHLLAFQSLRAVNRFKRADKIEALPALHFEPYHFGGAKSPTYEAWSYFGEKLLGYDEAVARQAALAAPLHAMILWRRVEKIMRKVPRRLASTRLAEFQARAAFMRTEVAPKARAARRTKLRLPH